MNTDTHRITELMAAFGGMDSSFRQVETAEEAGRWIPTTESEKLAFEALTAIQNRCALKAWYAAISSLNPHALLFHQILEQTIGERLPLGNSSRSG